MPDPGVPRVRRSKSDQLDFTQERLKAIYYNQLIVTIVYVCCALWLALSATDVECSAAASAPWFYGTEIQLAGCSHSLRAISLLGPTSASCFASPGRLVTPVDC